jgi:hypothetical protein
VPLAVQSDVPCIGWVVYDVAKGNDVTDGKKLDEVVKLQDVRDVVGVVCDSCNLLTNRYLTQSTDLIEECFVRSVGGSRLPFFSAIPLSPRGCWLSGRLMVSKRNGRWKYMSRLWWPKKADSLLEILNVGL